MRNFCRRFGSLYEFEFINLCRFAELNSSQPFGNSIINEAPLDPQVFLGLHQETRNPGVRRQRKWESGQGIFSGELVTLR